MASPRFSCLQYIVNVRMRAYQRLLIPTLAILLIYAALPNTVVQGIRDTAVTTVRPAGSWLSRHSSAVHHWYHNLKQVSTLRKDKERLQQEVVYLQKQLSDQERIRQENTVLHQQLSLPQHTPQLPQMMGTIVLRGNDPLDQTYVVDLGSEDGIQNGQAAVYQGYLVGRVVETRKHTSVVRSTTSRDSIIQAWTTENHYKGLLVGDGNTVYFSEVEQGASVPIHSVLETSGLGKSLPQGILIGSVTELRSKPSELSQRFSVTQPVDLTTMNTLFIILTTNL